MMGLLANPFMDSTVATPPETVAQADASPHSPDASAVFDSSNERRFQEAPVPDALNPHEGAGALDELQELLAYAQRRHRVFVPDEDALLAAIWADEPPLFLRETA